MKTELLEDATQIFVKDMFGFIHYLRAEGFAVTSRETITAFQALERLRLSDETEVMLGLRTVLCSTRSERDRFASLFIAFFRGTENSNGFAKITDGNHTGQKRNAEQKTTETAEVAIKTESAKEDEPDQVGITNDPQDGSVNKDTSFLQAVRKSQAASKQLSTVSISREHYHVMSKAARAFIQSVQLKPSRRFQPQPKGTVIDVRRTIRKSLGTGGYAIDPASSGRRKNKARFVLLCDGSRSMTPYTQVFLQFAAALHRQENNTELFLFSTKVRRVTHLLKSHSPHFQAFTKLGPEWGGGTCIGEALTDIIRTNRLQLLSDKTIFIIFSDGLESGDVMQLEQGMHTLKQRVNSILWLNPLLGKSGYEPLARGMQLALPYIDIFAAAHEVAAFQNLARHIRRGNFERKQGYR